MILINIAKNFLHFCVPLKKEGEVVLVRDLFLALWFHCGHLLGNKL